MGGSGGGGGGGGGGGYVCGRGLLGSEGTAIWKHKVSLLEVSI